MIRARPLIRATQDQRLYVRARAVLLLILASLLLFELDYPGGPGEWLTYVVLLFILSATTTVLYWQESAGPEAFIQSMKWALPVDLICVVGFTYLMSSWEDAFYPVVIMLPVVFALHMGKREAWFVGAAAAAAYALGHIAAHSFTGPMILLHTIKIAAIPILAAIVAASTERMNLREREAREAVAERDETAVQLSRRLSELQAVSQITEIIHSSLDFERVGPTVLEIVTKVVGIEASCLFVIDKDKSETIFSAQAGMQVPEQMAVRAGLDYGSLDDHFSCMALFDHGDIMVLLCASAEDIDRMTEDDRTVLTAVASELVVAIENSRLYRLTKKLAITDELTGLANYRHLQNRLDEEVERARRYDKQMSLLMIDVDDFKRFNDSHGHIAGDIALAELAHVLEASVREVDLAARYGGEEFSVILPETDAPGAYVTAEKLREAVSLHQFLNSDGEAGTPLTVSVGLASFPAHASDKEALLREADGALYLAKRTGKDRVKTPAKTSVDVTGVATSDGSAADELEGD